MTSFFTPAAPPNQQWNSRQITADLQFSQFANNHSTPSANIQQQQWNYTTKNSSTLLNQQHIDPNMIAQQKDMIDALSKTVQQQAQMLEKMMHQMALAPKIQQAPELTNPFIEFFESDRIGVSMWKYITQHEKVLICANQTFARMVGMSLAELSYKRFTMSDLPLLLLGDDRNDPEIMKRYLEQQGPSIKMGRQYNSFINEIVRRLQKTQRVVVFGNAAYIQTLIQQNNMIFAKFEPTDVFEDSLTLNHIQMPKTYEIRDLAKVSAKDLEHFGHKYLHAAKAVLYPMDTRDITAFQDTPEQQREFERRYMEDKRKRAQSQYSSQQEQQQQQKQSVIPPNATKEELHFKTSLQYQIQQFHEHHDVEYCTSDSHSREVKTFSSEMSAKNASEFDKRTQAPKLTPVDQFAENRMISVPSPDMQKSAPQKEPSSNGLLPNLDSWDFSDELFSTDAGSFFRE